MAQVPVYEDDLDEIVGVLHVKDVFLALAHGFVANGADQTVETAFSVKSLMREILKVPESLNVNDLLTQMQHSRVHIAVAID